MKGKNVGIIGAGRSGIAAANLLRRLGARVFLSDSGTTRLPKIPGIEMESGRHSSRLLASDLIIRSPGVPGHLPILKRIARRGIAIWSELELASRYAESKRLIAITGTNGKTTVTTLVGEIFKATRGPTFVAGNIGTPLSDVALKTTAQSTVVLEVSSYQLEDIRTFHPDISAILNITPDHLEHHGTMRAYASAKARVFENQTPKDVCVLNADDAWCRRLAKRCRAKVFFFSRTEALSEGIYYVPSPGLRPTSPQRRGDVKSPLLGERAVAAGNRGEGTVVLRWNGRRAEWPLRSNLPGPHNVENILAAIAIAVAGGVPLSVIRRVLAKFQGVEHRLELVRTLRGVRYINDSKATNVDSTRVALASFSEPLIVIMGGEGKGSPYSPLRPLIRRAVKKILLIGEDAPRIEKELKGAAGIERVHTMAAAVRRAAALGKRGDVVLLSPACASFDQYQNYEERGRDFKTLVRKLP